jgi:hypothetical protein
MQAQDRTQPKPGHPPQLSIKNHRLFLANGLKVMIVENHKLPKVTLS